MRSLKLALLPGVGILPLLLMLSLVPVGWTASSSAPQMTLPYNQGEESLMVTQEYSAAHRGVDFARAGNPTFVVYTTAAGSTHNPVPGSPEWQGYGYVVYVDHFNGIRSVYGHILTDTRRPEADWRPRLEWLAAADCTGICSGNHLHFETRLPDQTRVDPKDYFSDYFAANGNEDTSFVEGHWYAFISLHGKTYLITHWEDGEPLGHENWVQYSLDVIYPELGRVPVGEFGVPNVPGWGGSYYLRMAGQATSSGHAYCYYRLFTTDLTIRSGMKLRWHQYNYDDIKMAPDAHFTNWSPENMRDQDPRIVDGDGTSIHPAERTNPTGAWYYYEVNLNPLIDAHMDYFMMAYDYGYGAGTYRAYFDNLFLDW